MVGRKNFINLSPMVQEIINGKMNLLDRFEPVDIVALVVITGGLILTGMHINGIVGNMLTAISFYYFGKKGRTGAI